MRKSIRRAALSVPMSMGLEGLEKRRLFCALHGNGTHGIAYEQTLGPAVDVSQMDADDAGGGIIVDKDGNIHCTYDTSTSAADYVLGNKWGSSTVSYGYSNLFSALTSDMTNREIRDSINEALLVWSAVSPLKFIEAADPGGTVNDNSHSIESPQIRIGAHFIDGSSGSNVLAHAYGPGTGRGGDLHFDTGNTYNLTSAEYFIETSAHEIGHAIGLGHANGDVVGGSCPTPKPAIMDACIQGRYGEPGDAYLLADDINGVQAHYGAGLGYVLESSGDLYVSGTQGANTFNISYSGANITIESEGFGSFTRSTSGINSITVYGRGGNDTFWVNGVPSTLDLNIVGADGNDVAQIGNANYDNNILGNISLNMGNGTDEAVVNDILDELGSDVHTFDLGFKYHKTSGGEVNFIGDVESFSLVASGNNDTINILQVPVGVTFNINGWGGNDAINIGNGDFDFWVGGNVTVSGSSGTDSLNILDASDAGADTHTLDNNTYSKSSEVNTVQYSAMETVNLTAATGDYANIFNLNGGPTDGTVNVDGGDGDDIFNVGGNDIDTNAVNTTFNIDGQAGVDVLNYNDGNDAGDTDVYTINTNQVLKVGGGVTTAVNLTSISSQVINTSLGGTQIDGIGIGRQTTINAGAGDDTIDLDDNYAITIGSITLNYATALNTGTGADHVLLNDDNSAESVWATFDQSETLGNLVIGSGGLLTMLQNGLRFLSTDSATISGRLNLYDNMFIRRALGTSSSAFYRTRLHNGYNNGLWNGAEPSIYSTTAAGNANYALGYALKSEAPAVIALGTTINADDLIIRLTQKGDTDLDRDVDFDDLLRLSQAYGSGSNNYWRNGDYDYDGDVDFDNLLTLAQRYGQPYLTAAPSSLPSTTRKSAMRSLDADAVSVLA